MAHIFPDGVSWTGLGEHGPCSPARYSILKRLLRTLSNKKAAALLVVQDPFYNSQRDQIVGLAAHHKLPVMYPLREFTEIGGLVSFGHDLVDGYRQMGVYVGRILKGEKPADLPVVQPAKFEFVITLKTAKTLGLTIPPSLFSTADEVIE